MRRRRRIAALPGATAVVAECACFLANAAWLWSRVYVRVGTICELHDLQRSKRREENTAVLGVQDFFSSRGEKSAKLLVILARLVAVLLKVSGQKN